MEPLCCHHLNAVKENDAEAAGRLLHSNALGVGRSMLYVLRCTFSGTFRAISTARLSASPRLHLRPIDVVVFDGPWMRSNLGAGFVLRCFQHLSCPDAATRLCSSAEQPVHRRSVQHGPLVLVSVLLKSRRPQQIETELSHDVLNPARVPL